MAKRGKRYPLVIYTHMIDRWWPAILALGTALLALAWGVYSWGFEQWRWMTFASIGGLTLLMGLLSWILRKAAYVQPYSDHLLLATPFLRLKISYKRFLRTSSANIGTLFPPSSISKWQVEIVQPIAKMTASVIDLRGFPMSPFALRLFLSPLFFKDKTPHIVILVDDWMKFSSDLESMRTGGSEVSAPQKKQDNSILSRLPGKDK
jgi:hypothetical protein